jgi:hypothetical protein
VRVCCGRCSPQTLDEHHDAGDKDQAVNNPKLLPMFIPRKTWAAMMRYGAA